MAEQGDFRTALDEELFQEIGKEVTLISKTAPTYNDRGEVENVSSSNSTVTIVPYNIDHEVQNHQPWGDSKDGQQFAAVRYDVEINIDDAFVIESENWLIKDIERNYLPDNVVSIVRLVREQS